MLSGDRMLYIQSLGVQEGIAKPGCTRISKLLVSSVWGEFSGSLYIWRLCKMKMKSVFIRVQVSTWHWSRSTESWKFRGWLWFLSHVNLGIELQNNEKEAKKTILFSIVFFNSLYSKNLSLKKMSGTYEDAKTSCIHGSIELMSWKKVISVKESCVLVQSSEL